MLRLSCVMILATFAIACAQQPAARVDDLEVERSVVDGMLRAVANNRGYIRHFEQKNGGPPVDADGTPARAFTASVVTNEITGVVTEDEARKRDLDVTSADERRGRLDASGTVGGPTILAAFPVELANRFAERAALTSAFERILVRGISAREYYDDHRDEFVRPCTRDLVVRDRSAAFDARARIRDGEVFDDVAREVSLDEGTAPKGGDLGCNPPDDLVPELGRASLTQEVGEVGDPIETPEGVHLLLVASRDVPAFSKVEGEAAAAVVTLGKRRLSDILTTRLRDATVSVASEYGRWDADATMVVPR